MFEDEGWKGRTLAPSCCRVLPSNTFSSASKSSRCSRASFMILAAVFSSSACKTSVNQLMSVPKPYKGAGAEGEEWRRRTSSSSGPSAFCRLCLGLVCKQITVSRHDKKEQSRTTAQVLTVLYGIPTRTPYVWGSSIWSVKLCLCFSGRLRLPLAMLHGWLFV